MTICLVACAATKRRYACQAKDLYVSHLFEKSRTYVEQRGWQWYILSAKHHLLDPEQVIEPYEKTLKTMRAADRKQWARDVITQLERVLHKDDMVIFLAGRDYREHLAADIERICGTEPQVPMKGLRIGEQLSWLERHIHCGQN
jgi:hypothetical protein